MKKNPDLASKELEEKYGIKVLLPPEGKVRFDSRIMEAVEMEFVPEAMYITAFYHPEVGVVRREVQEFPYLYRLLDPETGRVVREGVPAEELPKEEENDLVVLSVEEPGFFSLNERRVILPVKVKVADSRMKTFDRLLKGEDVKYTPRFFHTMEDFRRWLEEKVGVRKPEDLEKRMREMAEKRKGIPEDELDAWEFIYLSDNYLTENLPYAVKALEAVLDGEVVGRNPGHAGCNFCVSGILSRTGGTQSFALRFLQGYFNRRQEKIRRNSFTSSGTTGTENRLHSDKYG